MNKLSVVIRCKNEENNIRRCLDSVQWADEIVVYDTGSTDKTIEICKEYDVSLYQTFKWAGDGPDKNKAVSLAKHDWIFVVDADEEVTDELRNAIQTVLNNPNPKNLYKINRLSFYMGKLVKHTWSNDYVSRLFNKKYGNYNLKKSNSYPVIEGESGKLHEILYHYTYPNIQSHIQKIAFYSKINAEMKFEKGVKSGICKAIFRGIGKFIKSYFLKLGFLDGKIGLIIAINSAFSVYLRYLFIWEKQQFPLLRRG